MGDYVGNKKQMKFKSIDSLKPIEDVIADADKALNDKSRKIQDSPLSEVLAGACGVGTGAAIGFAGLYFGGSVVGLSAAGITSGLAAAGGLIGGGMAVGIAVGISTTVKYKKLKAAKELTYKNAVAKQTAIIKALQEEVNADKERIDYLNNLNVLLQAAIKDLQHDLGIAA